MSINVYGPATGAGDEGRYSLAECTGLEKRAVTGNPIKSQITTSYVERQNLTIQVRDAPLHATDQRSFQEDQEPRPRSVASLHALRFRAPHKTFTKAANGYSTTPVMAAGAADPV